MRSGSKLVVHVERVKRFISAPELLEKGQYEVKEMLEGYKTLWKGRVMQVWTAHG